MNRLRIETGQIVVFSPQSTNDYKMDKFQSEYVKAYEALNVAKQRYETGRFRMRRDVLSKANVSGSGKTFWRLLPSKYHETMKGLYDVSFANSNGLIDILSGMSYEPYLMTRWVANGIDKFHICDLEQKGGITVPMDVAGWETLANLVAKLVEAKKLSVKANKKGDAHGTMMAKHMRETVERDDPAKMGEFMGCMMWMMETPQMNRSMKASRSSSQGFDYEWNSSTILCRVLPKVAPVVEAAEEPKAAEEVVEEAQEEEDIPESWEDLDF